ncbi:MULTISPECIES: peptidase inhibitor family I36 protein [unclassified Streptomyces]|uniref:peptidase inhibitor family I36 protein n=1 Tax=unclassified Streptomyces TaxID=2593676 RepID=UPI00380BC495
MRMHTILTISTIGSMVLTGVTAVPSLAVDDTGSIPEFVSDVLTPEAEEKVHAEADAADKVDMYYKGEKVDPASGWAGADVCVEVSEDGTMQCFDSNAESNKYLATHAPTAETRAGAKQALTSRKYSDCPSSYVCLWQNSNYSGRRLQWPTYDQAKTRHLDQYTPSFRDKASSAYVNRPQRGVTLYDFRTGLPDPIVILAAGYTLWPNLTSIEHPYGGSWNDKADAIKF